MAKIAQNGAKPSAWIVSPKDKGRKSIKNNKVYLTNGSEFEIELSNPLTECVLADIKLNGQSISKTGLVLKPGQRFYLDCFIDDKKKFIFNTYEVENSQESTDAIKNNGLLEVFFYKESIVTLENWRPNFNRIIVERYYPVYHYYHPGYYSYPNYINYGSGSTLIGGNGITYGSCTTNTATFNSTTGTTLGSEYSTLTGNTSNSVNNLVGTTQRSTTTDNVFINSSVETGRVEKGQSSSQKFSEVDMNFDSYYISSTFIQILPDSRKPIEVKDIKKPNIKDIFKRESNEVIDLIKKLADLHSAGILTDEEFSVKKAELLSKI